MGSYVMTPDVSTDKGAGHAPRNGHQPRRDAFAAFLARREVPHSAELRALSRAFEAGVAHGLATAPPCGNACCAESVESTLRRHGLAHVGLTEREAAVAAAVLVDTPDVVPHATILARAYGGYGLRDVAPDRHLVMINVHRMRPALLAEGWCLDSVTGRGLRAHRVGEACDPAAAPHGAVARARAPVGERVLSHTRASLQRRLAPEAARLTALGRSREDIAQALRCSVTTVRRALLWASRDDLA